MSVECGFFALDWDTFPQRLAQAEDNDLLVDEMGDDQVDSLPDSKKWQGDLALTYEKLAPYWKGPSADAFKEVFGMLFWDWLDGEYVLDVPEEQADMFDLIWSPDRVQRLAKRWKEIDLETARAPFEEAVRNAKYRHWVPAKDFDRWKTGIAAYGRMLEQVADQNRGLAEYIWG